MSYDAEDLTPAGALVVLGVAAFLGGGLLVGGGLTVAIVAVDRVLVRWWSKKKAPS